MSSCATRIGAVVACTSLVGLAPAAPPIVHSDTQPDAMSDLRVVEQDNGTITVGELAFAAWIDYFQSDFFREAGMKCGTPNLPIEGNGAEGGGTFDCTDGFTNPSAVYDPSVVKYRIPVVVHILQHPNGNGNVPDSLVHSQIDVLNEDFLALAGTNGGQGTDVQIEFYLATTDPNGNPTTGITRHTKKIWYQDGGNYCGQLAWDTTNYLNIYTNTASGNLGYAFVPNGGGVVGASCDRVVIHWLAFGRPALGGAPYNLGRTATHEVGHYLGLYHTFDPENACPSASGCNANGDLICDTNPEFAPRFDECSGSSCGSADPWENYMDYSDDACMTEFTFEQARRLRCTLEHWRPDLYELTGPATGACCHPNESCTVETSADCGSLGGTYQGDNTGCTPNPCVTPTGACCQPGEVCTVETAADCGSLGGTYQGDGTGCSPNPCVTPTGACCFPGEVCFVETEADCSTMGGTYQGDGTGCSPNPCAVNAAIVDCITYTTRGGPLANKHLDVTVTIVDGGNNPISGASVSLTLSGGGTYNFGGTTDANGDVTFSLINAANTCYTSDVTAVTGTGLSFDGTEPANGFQKGSDSTPDADCRSGSDGCGSG